jgi:hypothetical protein
MPKRTPLSLLKHGALMIVKATLMSKWAMMIMAWNLYFAVRALPFLISNNQVSQ